MITGINELKTSTRQIPFECKCKFGRKLKMVENGIQIKSGIIINVYARLKYITYVKEIILGILLHVITVNNGKHLEKPNHDSVIMCEEIIEEIFQQILMKKL